MQHNTLTSKILLTFFSLGFITWFGGTIARTTIAFDIFESSPKLQLVSHYNDETRMYNVHLYGSLASYTDIGYCMALICSIILFIYWRKNIKHRGWLFMAFILFFISAPIELLLIYYDIKLNIAHYWYNVQDFNNPAINQYFIERFKNVAITIPSGLSFLAAVTCVLYVIWRPLNKTNEDVNTITEGENEIK
jgi:hypothetical protein